MCIRDRRQRDFGYHCIVCQTGANHRRATLWLQEPCHGCQQDDMLGRAVHEPMPEDRQGRQNAEPYGDHDCLVADLERIIDGISLETQVQSYAPPTVGCGSGPYEAIQTQMQDEAP
eukprot:5414172-Karenia_brevis.AAC.1